MATGGVGLGRSGWRIVAAMLASLPILGLGLFALIPFRPAATVYAMLVGLVFALARWLLAAGHLLLPRVIRRLH